MTSISTRRLIWAPIVHTQTDLGTMGEEVRRLQIQKVGRPKWEPHRKAVEESWALLRRHVEGLDLSWAQVRLYQDGLPYCDHEREIVESLAKAGSLNHRLLLDLVNKGVTLVGTESPKLLGEEFEIAGQILTIANSVLPEALRQVPGFQPTETRISAPQPHKEGGRPGGKH